MISVDDNCPFCREPVLDNEECDKSIMKRVEANDPAAMNKMGLMRYEEGDYDGAVKYFSKGAELEDLMAHYHLGVMYRCGKGVEKDVGKAVYHYEIAAIGGDPYARNNLGCIEEKNGMMERAVKHFIIAANFGHTGAMNKLWEYYKDGNITKEDLEATLRAHQAAIDAMKSPQREAAAAAGYGG